MNKLEEARLEIEQIDNEMMQLFVRRMMAVKQVLEYKMENNLPIYDEKREIELIKKNVLALNNKELEKYYQIFFEGVLNSSKTYQGDNYA